MNRDKSVLRARSPTWLTPVASTLEDAYMALTADSVEYQSEDLAAVDQAAAERAADLVTEGDHR